MLKLISPTQCNLGSGPTISVAFRSMSAETRRHIWFDCPSPPEGNFEFQLQDYFVSVGTRLAGAGDAGQSVSTNYGTLQNGLEVRRPLGFTVKDVQPDVGVSFILLLFLPVGEVLASRLKATRGLQSVRVRDRRGPPKPITLWILEIEKPRSASTTASGTA